MRLRSSPQAGTPESRKLPKDLLVTWVAITAFAAIDWLWVLHAGFTITGIPELLRTVALVGAIGFFFEYTGRSKWVSDAANYLALWISLAIALNVYSYAVATLRMPMWDAQFARADVALGFHWSAIYNSILPHPMLRFVLRHAYNSFLLQIFGSIGYLAIFGHTDRNRELLWIGLVSALITTSLSGVFPALGPYEKEVPSWSAILVTIRSGGISKFALGEMAGIVAFPSFHTVAAVFLVYVHRHPLRSFIPIAILNAVMVVAIPFAGHHYLVDVISGAGVAVVSILIVRAAMRRGFLGTT